MEQRHFFSPMEWRARYAVKKLGIPAKKVKNIIAERDKMQKWFLRMICGSEIDDLHLFHISLNMEIDSFSRATEAIMAVAGAYPAEMEVATKS